GNRDHRQKADEQKIHREKHAERAEIRADVHPGLFVKAPVRRQKILIQRADDDGKALEPHADVDENGENENEFQVLPDTLEPKQLRHEKIDHKHDPAAIPISMTEQPMTEHPT